MMMMIVIIVMVVVMIVLTMMLIAMIMTPITAENARINSVLFWINCLQL